MIDLKKIHERESFELQGQREMAWSSVKPTISALGFVLIDDFVSVKRTDNVESWQTETLAHCTFLAGGKQVYPDESNFDSLVFSMLICALPKEQIMKAIQVLYDLANQLGINVTFATNPTTRIQADALIERWLANILDETGDVCGSESANILIEMEYEKRRA
jgi:hypothetical protein